jgi:hypothetical protein
MLSQQVYASSWNVSFSKRQLADTASELILLDEEDKEVSQSALIVRSISLSQAAS